MLSSVLSSRLDIVVLTSSADDTERERGVSVMKGGCKATFCILCSVTVAVFVTSFNSFSKSVQSCEPCNDPIKALMDRMPQVFPYGNCNCTVSYTPGSMLHQQPTTPSLSCKCKEAPTTCPPATVQVVEREVVKEVVKEIVKREGCDPVPWHANKPFHYPARFPLCSMDACFNYSRCANRSELLIFPYNTPATPRHFFSRINESKYFTNDPAKACIFLVFLPNETNPLRENPTTLPYWNGGLNHAVVSFESNWPHQGFPQESIGNASVMGTEMHETTYRAGFDISIPLPGKLHTREIQKVKATERKYLATFKGLRYLGRSGEGTFRSWDSFRMMHNGIDVIVATTCKHQLNDMIRAKDPTIGVHCDNDEILHRGQVWADLMNSTFALVPSGIQAASYRFIEVLSAGAIPVLIADNYVRPYDNLIQWHKCLLQFPTTEIPRIVATLRAMKEGEIRKRQENCIAIYREFLQDDEILLHTSIRALKARFVGAIPGFSEV